MTIVDPYIIASQYDEDEAEATLPIHMRKYLKANRVSQNSIMDVLNITSGADLSELTDRPHAFQMMGRSCSNCQLCIVYGRSLIATSQCC